MRYYPVNLDIQNRNCLVVGGGSVGTRKVSTLLACGARVSVITLQASQILKDLFNKQIIQLKQRPYESADLGGVFLVIGATNNKILNLSIYNDAIKSNMLCNIADQPEFCNFILPAIVNRGDLILAISTSGKSPAFAKKLRKDLEKQFGPEYAEFLSLMGKIRKKLLAQKHEPEAHKALFEQLIAKGLLQLIKENRKIEIDLLLIDTFGPGFEIKDLNKETSE